MKKFLPLLLALSLGVAAAPNSATFLVGFPKQSFETGVDTEVDFEVLGGVAGQTWQTGLQATAAKGTRYSLWSLAGRMPTSGIGSAKESYGPPCEETFSVKVSPPAPRKNWVIASSASWNLRPRPVVVLSTNNSIYKGVVKDYLEKLGLKNPDVQINSLVKVDLDNDKQDEIIIAATRVDRALFPSARANQGDYSVLLVRKIINGQVQTIALGEEVHLKGTTDADIDAGRQNNPDIWDLVNVLDLNGDGQFEVLYFDAIYEDYAVFAKSWNGKEFVTRLVSGCGS